MSGLAGAAAVCVAVVFALAAGAKWRDRPTTAHAFRDLGLAAPERWVAPVVFVELGLAMLLIVRPAIGGPAAIATLIVFSVVLAVAIRRGDDVVCGCFGATGDRPVGPVDLVRNGALVLTSFVAATGTGIARPSLVGLVTVTALGAAVALVLQLLTIRSQIGSVFRIELAGEVS